MWLSSRTTSPASKCRATPGGYSCSPDVLPPSYRVVPVDPDPDEVATLGAQFDNAPGVREVRYATEALRNLEDLTNSIKNGLSWLGLDWDGDILSQFERKDRHAEIAHELVKKGGNSPSAKRTRTDSPFVRRCAKPC